MKTLSIISVLLFFFFNSTFAQESNGEGKEQQYAQLLNLSPISAPARSFDNRYQGVQGSPYLWDDYREALIINPQNDTIRGLNVRLNLVGPYVEVSALGGIHGKITYDNLVSLTVKNLMGHLEYYKTGIIDGELALLEVLYDGDLKFYRLLKKGFLKANYQGAYSAGKPYDEYIDQFTYYLVDGDDQLQMVKLKAKSLVKILPQHKTEIQQYFKNREIENGADLKTLLVSIDK